MTYPTTHDPRALNLPGSATAMLRPWRPLCPEPIATRRTPRWAALTGLRHPATRTHTTTEVSA